MEVKLTGKSEVYKNRYKKKVALFSLIVSIFLVIIKVLVAYFSNSIGVLSEALNNSLDLVTVLITFLAVRIATRPPDKDHTYGHGKYENLSALLEIIIIFFLSFFIIYKSIQRIITQDFDLRINIYVFIVLVISIIINMVRVYFVGNAARRYNSFAFKSQFLNYSGDIINSVIVIIGLVFASRGYYLADPIASIIVSLIIIGFGMRLAIRVIRNFLDYIPAEITEKVHMVLKNKTEIKTIYRIKIHEVGNIKFINIDVGVDDNIYISQVEKIKKAIKKEVSDKIPGAETIIEIRPALSRENIDCIVKEVLIDQKHVKDIHNVFLYNIGDQIDISAHIELDKLLNLEESEQLTGRIEDTIKKKIKNIRNIYIHIEDAKPDEDWDDVTSKSEKMINQIKKNISSHISPETCHKFTVLERNGTYNIAFHCRLDRDMDVKKAHSIITQVENMIKRISKSINEVSIHMEPT
jgi:cation diffusion facilitator family transporter